MYIATVSAANEAIIDNFQNDFRWIERPTPNKILLRLDDDDARDFLFEYVSDETYLTGNDADGSALLEVTVERRDEDAFATTEGRLEASAFEAMELQSVKTRGERQYTLVVERADGDERLPLSEEQYSLVQSLLKIQRSGS